MTDITPQQFGMKWKSSSLKESAAYFDHFNELCELVGHAKPSDFDPDGTHFTFQRFAAKESGKPGFADVWFRERFGVEYKGKGDNLESAYRQLLQYRDNLANPPLLIVSDFESIEVHTNFNDTVSEVFIVTIDDLIEGKRFASRRTTDGKVVGALLSPMEVLHACFYEPELLKPTQTTSGLTEEASKLFESIADGLRGWHPSSDREIARYLSRLIFCMFSSDVGLLPKNIITQIIDNANPQKRDAFAISLTSLFNKMSSGGSYGLHTIEYFDGGLFGNEIEPLQDDGGIRQQIKKADQLDWAQVEPSVFGTLFERIFNPDKRSQLGRHYTPREEIETLIKPVIMTPLQREWDELRSGLESTLEHGTPNDDKLESTKQSLQNFIDRLSNVKILDPACGSGNFLYVGLSLLKGLEQAVVTFAANHGIIGLEQHVHPRQLFGIEYDPYAHELASIVVWIGYLQWKHRNGIPYSTEIPILEPLANIENKDAVLEVRSKNHPINPDWPTVDYIVGNPPFLGGKLLRRRLGDIYVDNLFNLWEGRVRSESDLCCYWFEKAREHIAAGRAIRAGLIATQAIRGGANRDTLKRIKESGDIFFAESDRPWILDGAAVRISMVGFDGKKEPVKILNGAEIPEIHSNLTGTTVDVTRAVRLKKNLRIAFMGDTKGGAFDITVDLASKMLASSNPHQESNQNVVRRWINASDVTGRDRNMHIVDFPVGMSEADAAMYEAPFEYLRSKVKPVRASNKRPLYRDRWWHHVEARPGMRAAIASLNRFVVTPTVAKHRLFKWIDSRVLPDHALIVFARDDDYFFGVLHSWAHEVWALATGTQLREKESGFRYTPTTTFETFPFPRSTEDQKMEIAAAAKKLNELRENWLNPPAGSVSVSQLKKKTLTNLYNERPTWLDNAHGTLDKAVFAAYGWTEDPKSTTGDAIIKRLLELNLQGDPA